MVVPLQSAPDPPRVASTHGDTNEHVVYTEAGQLLPWDSARVSTGNDRAKTGVGLSVG